jgi:undecaprenyl-diphosphatase
MSKRNERRERPRGRLHHLRDLLFHVLRAIARHAGGFYTAVGIYLIVGAGLAVLGTWAFEELGDRVMAGTTQAFDTAVLTWMGAHRINWIEQSLLEITALGTGLVVMTMVAVTSLFLALTEHRWSAFLLIIATAGELVLNDVLKLAYHRPRPQVFVWATHASSTSFPSGHAMSAIVVYTTIAYLAARLEKRAWARTVTLLVAALIIGLICVSRLYLGVHYPSDVVAGLLIGLAWAGFCVSGLEAVQLFAKRFKKSATAHERQLEPAERRAEGFDR